MKRAIIAMIIIIVIAVIIAISINVYIVKTGKKKIITKEQAKEIEDADYILILGAGVRGNEPSPMLRDRLLQGIDIYNGSAKILMSGDSTREDYDEVNVMKNFAVERGISADRIENDYEGVSTYDSIYRAKNVFGAKKIIIVTQEYHLYRALHIAKKLGIDAYGVASNLQEYAGQTYRDIREIVARNKDFLKCLF